MAITYAVPSFWRLGGTWAIGAHLVLMGVFVGLAIGTVDWTYPTVSAGLPLQLWWTPWVIIGQVSLIRRLVASQSSPWLSALSLRSHDSRFHDGSV